jgi:4-amino-4-deoxy-L-arabinose transferase-like glycosyltransferase
LKTMATETSTSHVRTASSTWDLVVTGYSTVAVALVAFLTINGASGIPSAATIGTAVLLVIGFLLPVAGMLGLRRSLEPSKGAARNGFALQAIGLVGLLIGVVLVVAVSTLTGYLLSAAFVATAGVLSVAGTVLLRRYYSTTATNARDVAYLIFGTALIFLGAGLIVGSNIAYQYLFSQMENTIYVDMGAAVSACGCVVAAYSFFVLRNHG